MSKIEIEKKVLNTMVKIYCKGQGHSDLLCNDCEKFIEYANQQLDRCKFGENKVFCSKCNIHCYKPEMRNFVKKVMGYSGSRIIFYYPIIAIKHLLSLNIDSFILKYFKLFIKGGKWII